MNVYCYFTWLYLVHWFRYWNDESIRRRPMRTARGSYNLKHKQLSEHRINLICINEISSSKFHPYEVLWTKENKYLAGNRKRLSQFCDHSKHGNTVPYCRKTENSKARIKDISMRPDYHLLIEKSNTISQDSRRRKNWTTRTPHRNSMNNCLCKQYLNGN